MYYKDKSNVDDL